jgi:propionyl-CoA carboxylase alpha chain
MISKLSVYAPTREKAIQKMKTALSEYEIEGCQTTISFCDYCMQHPNFLQGQYDTHFVSDYFTPDLEQNHLSCSYLHNLPKPNVIALMAGVLFEKKSTNKNPITFTHTPQNTTAERPWWTARRS